MSAQLPVTHHTDWFVTAQDMPSRLESLWLNSISKYWKNETRDFSDFQPHRQSQDSSIKENRKWGDFKGDCMKKLSDICCSLFALVVPVANRFNNIGSFILGLLLFSI